MKRTLSALIAATLLVAACGGAGTPAPAATTPAAAATPAPTAAPPNQVVFTADLKASNEVPPIANDEKNASGTATITFDLTRSGGTISAATAKFDVSVKDLGATAKVTIAHIHEAAAGVNGGVKVNTGLTADTAPAVTAGAVSFSKTGIAVDGALAQSIITTPANFYFNLHSVANPGGTVRGQLVKK